MQILNDRVLAQDILDNGFGYRRCIFKQLQSVVRYLHHEGETKENILKKCADLLKNYDEDGFKYAEMIDLENNSKPLEELYDISLKQEYRQDKYVYFSNQ